MHLSHLRHLSGAQSLLDLTVPLARSACHNPASCLISRSRGASTMARPHCRLRCLRRHVREAFVPVNELFATRQQAKGHPERICTHTRLGSSALIFTRSRLGIGMSLPLMPCKREKSPKNLKESLRLYKNPRNPKKSREITRKLEESSAFPLKTSDVLKLQGTFLLVGPSAAVGGQLEPRLPQPSLSSSHVPHQRPGRRQACSVRTPETFAS